MEIIIQNTIDKFYFNKEKKKRKKNETYEEIKKKLESAKLSVPTEKTILNRINAAIKKGRNPKNPSIQKHMMKVLFQENLPVMTIR